ncbi:MAG: hypothetical protein HYS32_00465 [Candidatus Woesearchaeota archaeon]|nr:MAG: hypothetical protein HYS32_00465 [Candidatus Woesearchaeota archaeon]
MKKGVSPLIAWVLIVGFTISLAVIVSNALKKQAESSTEKIEEFVEGGSTCNKITIQATPLNCDKGSGIAKFNLANKGLLGVDKIKARLFYADNTVGSATVSFKNLERLNPEKNIDIEVPFDVKSGESLVKVELVPIREDFGCSEKKEVLDKESVWFVGGC